mmetsp:Transcript_7628/g.22548  ORF Transcript_7628/g.22548 Transcript_7628/m.22548 type:complete len:380 (+) Transcript_7628:370-1509(+)
MSQLVTQANAAFVDEDYQKAEQLFAEAIAKDPRNAALLVSQAQAQMKLQDYLGAVESANQAVKLEPRNVKAQHRRGVAFWHMEEYEMAKEAFEAAQKLEPTNGVYAIWVAKCDSAIAEEGGGSYAAAPASKSSPTVAGPAPAAAAAKPLPPEAVPPAPAALVAAAAAPEGPPVEQPKPTKYRHDWLQMREWVEISIFAKKLNSERLTVMFQPKHLRVVIRDPQGEQEYEMSIDLYSEVDADACKYEVLGTKVELRLKKIDLSVSWPTLEASDSRPAANWSLPEPPRTQYPTSRKNVVDWNKLEADIKEEEKNETLDGDAGVQKLFRDIYSSADEDTRRAMNKSFQESNGTALSTNWKEIGSQKTGWKPPEDADVKKWEM